ncbi:unnamed protein product [Effrenium voratum]|uniref:Uncharacterized protein n=1 Tax=Effrenium voratum TaxID=2562239 RepID=A0AA36I1L8_9DINO|nr:unnamed protein product [Effrenium voratum]
MTAMGLHDPFAAFLEIRTPSAGKPSSRSTRRGSLSMQERLEGLRGLCSPKDFPQEDRVLEVDRLDAKAMDADLEESPFVSYLRLRPPKPVEEKPEPPLEQNLREDVLKTKKQLLEVALRMEMLASDPETAEETALRLRRLRKAQRYLLQPERAVEALSGSEDEEMTVQTKIVAASPSHAKKAAQSEELSLSQRRWSVGMVRRQPPPDISTPTPSRPSTVYKDELRLPSPMKGSKCKPQTASTRPSAPQLPSVPLCKQKPTYTTWEGDLVVDDVSNVPLTGWFYKTRSWNIHILRKDLQAERRIPDMAGGGVVFGNGTMPLFSGSHLLNTGYFYAFQVDAVDDQHFPLAEVRDMSLGFGVSFLPGGHRLCKKPMYAYEIPGSILIGYGMHVVDGGEWCTQKAWDPKALEVNDVVGLLVNPHGDLVVYVNEVQVLRVASSLTEGNRKEPHPRRKALGPRRTLFPVVDLHGRVTKVTMLPTKSPPNVGLQARNNTHEKNLNPLGFKGKKMLPVPGRTLPGLGKALGEVDDSMPGFKEF